MIELEKGILKELSRTLETIAPKSASYEHEKTWYDTNGHSHVKSAIMERPFNSIWTRSSNAWTVATIIIAEFDMRLRKRWIIVQMLSG